MDESPGYVGVTETWDGTSWTEVADLATARASLAGAGTNTLGLAFGGSAPAVNGLTEEWTGAGAPVGAWSTAANMIRC